MDTQYVPKLPKGFQVLVGPSVKSALVRSKHPDNIRFAEIEPWMYKQIGVIRSEQYGGLAKEREERFVRTLKNRFDNDRSIGLAALDGERVVGLQSYLYWPYSYCGEKYYSLQSGGTLVQKGYRGRRLFMRMLEAGNRMLHARGVDFVTGFPVKMSFGGFMKDHWIPVGSPRWFLKPLRPLMMLRQRIWGVGQDIPPSRGDRDWVTASSWKRVLSDTAIQLDTGTTFLQHRYLDNPYEDYWIGVYEVGYSLVTFICKIVQHHGFREMVVGDLLTDSAGVIAITRAFRHFLADALKVTDLSAVSIMLGGAANRLIPVLLVFGFMPLPVKVRFILKTFSALDNTVVTKFDKWSLMFADYDTW